MSGPVARWLPIPVLLAIGLGVGYAVLALPEAGAGLSTAVAGGLRASGVENPVTAVLLNFRAYDTLLEIAVLGVAVVAIWSLAEMPRRRAGAPGLVLAYLVQVLVPFMMLLGVFLLWAGSHAPGGAFQAGAVLAAALVLLLLAGAPLPRTMAGWPVRALLMLGPVTFIAVGLAMIPLEGHFLEFPPAAAKHLILLIEAASAVSIAVILASAFRGGRPPEPSP